jgi:hypothetical protein
MQEFTPEQIAHLKRLDDRIQEIGNDLRTAGVPISGPNGNPVLMEMLFEDPGAPLEGQRFAFECRVAEGWIQAATEEGPRLKEEAMRQRIQAAAQLRAEHIVPPGMAKPFGIVHDGRITKLRE